VHSLNDFAVGLVDGSIDHNGFIAGEQASERETGYRLQ